jgi:DNA-directed RNA polymerase III subunit RPC1
MTSTELSIAPVLQETTTQVQDSFLTNLSKRLEGQYRDRQAFQKAFDDMNPLRVLNLFRQVTNADCELLGMNPGEGRPEMFIWQFVPAPPVCIRPSVAQDSSSTEDDLTSKLSDIVHISSLIREGLKKGQPVQTIMEQWDYLQLQIAMYINSDVPGLPATWVQGRRFRGFCQRLKGSKVGFVGISPASV